jgi:uncharacterized Zn finger protein
MNACPQCGGIDLDVLRTSSSSTTFRCIDCDSVFTVSPAAPRTTTLRIIVSAAGTSQADEIEVVSLDVVSVGDEFEEAGHRYLVTAIEGPVGPTPSCRVADAKVVHAKLFDKVIVHVSVNDGEVTKSFQLAMEPEAAVRVGQVLDVQGRAVAVKTLKSDQNRTLRKGFLLARNVRRAFCDPAPGARPGEHVKARSRRAPAPERARRGPRGPRRGPPRGPRR